MRTIGGIEQTKNPDRQMSRVARKVMSAPGPQHRQIRFVSHKQQDQPTKTGCLANYALNSRPVVYTNSCLGTYVASDQVWHEQIMVKNCLVQDTNRT